MDIGTSLLQNDEETVFQYYTIVREQDAFISSRNATDLAFIESADEQSKVMYLSLKQDEEEAYAPNIVLNGACKEDDEDETAVANIKFITMQDGQMYMTDSTGIDDRFKIVDNEIVRCDNEDISVLTEDDEQGVAAFPSTSDNETELFPEDDFRKVKLEDGTCAYIDKTLWHSLLDNIEEQEDEEQAVLPSKKEKKYHCNYFGCNKVYTTAHHLTVHTRNHTGNRPYQCSEPGCDKAFATGYSLKAHMRTHTGESPYGCSLCPKQFKTSGDLQKHVRTHTGEKPFKCPIEGCGRSFTTSNIRKVHIRSHTGERPYACTFKDCGKAFASATNYKNHMRIHSGEKPYQCPVPGCEKRFTEYSSLFKHNAVHKPFTPLKCDYCGQLCKHKTTLRVHKQAMHDVVTTEGGLEIRLKEEEDNYDYLMVKNTD